MRTIVLDCGALSRGDADPKSRTELFMLPILIAICLVGGVVWWLLRQRRSAHGDPATYKHALGIFRGDEPRLRRAVARERARNPDLSEAEALRRVVSSYEKDNR